MTDTEHKKLEHQKHGGYMRKPHCPVTIVSSGSTIAFSTNKGQERKQIYNSQFNTVIIMTILGSFRILHKAEDPWTIQALQHLKGPPADQLPFLPLCFVINLDVSFWNTVVVDKVFCKVINHSTLYQDLVLPFLTWNGRVDVMYFGISFTP